jgi:hypothetical protein
METTAKQETKKKGFLAAVWESMTKTGWYCGAGGDCCGAPAAAGIEPHGLSPCAVQTLAPYRHVRDEVCRFAETLPGVLTEQSA